MTAPRPDRRIFSVCLLTVLLGTALPCAAQRESEFLGVKSWQGSLKIKSNNIGTNSANGGVDAWDFQWSADLQFKLDEFIPFGQFWRGKFTGGSAAVRHKNVLTSGGCTFTTSVIGQGLPEDPTFFLYVGPGNNYSFDVLGPSIPARFTATTVCRGETGTLTIDRPEGWFANNLDRYVKFALPATGFDLIGGGKYDMGGAMPLFTFGLSPPKFLGDVSWEFRGVASPLEVVIEPQGYDAWRPEALFDESTPANDISVKATLRHEDGSPLSTLEKAQKFEFELAKVSKEPGIAMNYPLAARAKRTPDLQFDEARNANLPITVKGGEHNQAESYGLPHETASIFVSSYDWGGWGEIKVTAVTGDGRRIVGYLKGDKPQTSVRLPKRPASSVIAEAWMKEKGGNKPDDDDSEPDPDGEPGCLGDGLTLYQEYRGFFENGAHIEGNPKKKDFFILNKIGADAEPGLWLFTEISGLEVHKDLTDEEFNFQDRLINGNYDKGPRRKDQHGVFIITDASVDGGITNFTQFGVAGRPGLTTGIRIQPRGQEYRSLSSPVNLSPIDQPLAYDVAIAHELLHSIGVAHHGPQDTSEEFELVYADDPANTEGVPFFRLKGAKIELINEKTGEDEAAVLYRTMRPVYDSMRLALAGDPQGWAAMQLVMRNLHFKIGKKGYEHSGNDSCVMRYFFANVYPADPPTIPDRYYWVPPGTEPLGSSICNSAEGTGVNGPRSPQPRYGDANLGKCRSQMCPNDAIPPPARR